MEWGSTWSSLGNVIAQANALKENLEKQLDEAVGVNEDGEGGEEREQQTQQQQQQQTQQTQLEQEDPQREDEGQRKDADVVHEDPPAPLESAGDVSPDVATLASSTPVAGLPNDDAGEGAVDHPQPPSGDGWGDGDDDDDLGLDSEPEDTDKGQIHDQTLGSQQADEPEPLASPPDEQQHQQQAGPAERAHLDGGQGEDAAADDGTQLQQERMALGESGLASAQEAQGQDNESEMAQLDSFSLRVSGEDPPVASQEEEVMQAANTNTNGWGDEMEIDLEESNLDDGEPSPEDGNETEQNVDQSFAGQNTSAGDPFVANASEGAEGATGVREESPNETFGDQPAETQLLAGNPEGTLAEEVLASPALGESLHEEADATNDLASQENAMVESQGEEMKEGRDEQIAAEQVQLEADEEEAEDAEQHHEQQEEEASLTTPSPSTEGDNVVPVMETSMGTSDVSPFEDRAAHETGRADLVAELAEAKRVLATREKQLEATMEQSASTVAENNALQEELGALKTQLEEMRETSRRQEMQSQGTQNNQRALQDALRKAEQRARNAEDRMKEAVRKHEALMEEGLGLSKRLGTVEQTVKKVREEKRTVEATCAELREKLGKSEASVKALREAQQAAEERHKKEVASMSAMSSSSAEAARKLSEAQVKASEQEARIAHLTSTLDEAWKEVAEQKRETSAVKQDLNAARVEQEKLRHQLKEQISSTQVRNDVASVMEKNVADMQKALEEQGSQQSMTEELLRAEIKSLKHQLALAEKRNEDLVSGSAKATRPLLRQIEALESANQAQRSSYESAHSSIMARLLAAEQAEQAARSARQQAEAARGDLHLRLADLQASLDSALAEKTRAEAQRQSVKERLAATERENAALEAQLEASNEQHEQRMAEMKASEAKLRRAMAMAEERREQEVADVTRLHEEARERLERKLAELESHARTSRLVQRSTSSRSSQEDILAELEIGGPLVTDQGAHPPDGELGAGAAPSMLLVQQLRGQVHQKQGQVESLMEQINSVEHARDALSEELVRVNERAQQASELSRELQAMSVRLEEKCVQHDVLLEMFGETQEELDEVRAEQETMRQSFRRQLEALAGAMPPSPTFSGDAAHVAAHVSTVANDE
ncbi:TATA element modulatory factor [Hondaea fermentalgiana]|uniref:TATA element modulatory factor n=1 Tax=Hondaea fermentalgiana TaxID=2315210 RepID=A0A2R5GMM1_9STRA|nr:TATA element modulatory factor [Hondaea fermentalgiana]|eukprot:GBG32130.1 TATA element modulatory factor [Hondaea fermentalgiana]